MAIVAGLISIDARVREHFSRLAAQTSSSGLTPIAEQLGEVGNAVMRAARDHSIDQAPLMLFSVVAVVLVLFMLRT